jgi:hypothetical protein
MPYLKPTTIQHHFSGLSINYFHVTLSKQFFQLCCVLIDTLKKHLENLISYEFTQSIHFSVQFKFLMVMNLKDTKCLENGMGIKQLIVNSLY